MLVNFFHTSIEHHIPIPATAYLFKPALFNCKETSQNCVLPNSHGPSHLLWPRLNTRVRILYYHELSPLSFVLHSLR